jgi:ureidoglycolate hydrolase
MKTIKAVPLTVENFKPFGWALTIPETKGDFDTDTMQYWDQMIDLTNLGEKGMIGFLRVKRMPLVCKTLDVLPNSLEFYISMDGKPSILPVAPYNSDRQKPDMSKMKAFIIEGNGVAVRENIWHCTPFPLAEYVNFALGLKNNVIIQKEGEYTVDDDNIIFQDLDEPVMLEF